MAHRKCEWNIKYSHRPINGDHFVVIVWIEENIVNIMLARCASYNCCSSPPIGGHIAELWIKIARKYD